MPSCFAWTTARSAFASTRDRERYRRQGRACEASDADPRAFVPLAGMHAPGRARALGMPSALVRAARRAARRHLANVSRRPGERPPPIVRLSRHCAPRPGMDRITTGEKIMSERRCTRYPELPCKASGSDQCGSDCTPPERGPRRGCYVGPHRMISLALGALLTTPPRSRRDK